MKKDSKTQLTPLETALQKQFKADAGRLDILIREAYERTAKIQAANITAMVGFGLLALSIKPIIGHGKFGDWLSGTLGGQLSKSTAYTWIKAAEWLIKKVDNADKQSDIVSERICAFTKSANIKDYIGEVFSNAKLTADFVAYVSRDLPFKTFLNILKTANTAAIEAEDEERRAIEFAKKKPTLRGLREGGPAESPQMLLWEDWTNELESIDRLFEAPEKQLLDPEHWLQVESKLVVWLESVRKITRGLRK